MASPPGDAPRILSEETAPHSASRRTLARHLFFAFVLTFMASRIVVFLIMARRIPDLYLHVGGNHVHHLNYGIFLLAGVGGYLLFDRGTPAERNVAAILYGIGLALTFDEFGMWLHLGGPYWQRASFDAMVVLAAGLGVIAFAPPLRAWRPRDRVAALILVASLALFAVLLQASFRFAAREQPRLEQLEERGPR